MTHEPKNYLIDRVERSKLEVEQHLAASYPNSSETDSQESTYEAMRYMIFLGGGGKRLRPTLTLEACRVLGGPEDSAWAYAEGIEVIHTYTLILDDIQNRSDQRRHQETCHVRFGTDTALLAAGRLYERGLAPFHRFAGADALECRRLLDLLHRGKAADLAAETWPPAKRTADALRFIHSGKTSALFQLALLGGAVAANAPSEPKQALLEYGYYLGLAFQARDDVLSSQSTAESIGKPAGEGADENKLTYPAVFGAKAMAEAHSLAQRASESLVKSKLSGTGVFEDLARFAATCGS